MYSWRINPQNQRIEIQMGQKSFYHLSIFTWNSLHYQKSEVQFTRLFNYEIVKVDQFIIISLLLLSLVKMVHYMVYMFTKGEVCFLSLGLFFQGDRRSAQSPSFFFLFKLFSPLRSCVSWCFLREVRSCVSWCFLQEVLCSGVAFTGL